MLPLEAEGTGRFESSYTQPMICLINASLVLFNDLFTYFVKDLIIDSQRL